MYAQGTPTGTRRLIFIPGVLLLVLFAGATAKADPLTFSNVSAFQNNNTVQVDLFSNTGTVLYGPSLTFSADIAGVLPMGGADTLRVTFTQIGSTPIVQEFSIPLFGTIQPPFTMFFSLVAPQSDALGVAATLTLDLLNSAPDFVIPGGPNQGQTANSYTYSFKVADPLPEPVTIVGVVTGLAALGLRLRRRD